VIWIGFFNLFTACSYFLGSSTGVFHYTFVTVNVATGLPLASTKRTKNEGRVRNRQRVCSCQKHDQRKVDLFMQFLIFNFPLLIAKLSNNGFKVQQSG